MHKPCPVEFAGTRYPSFAALARAYKLGAATVRKRFLRGVRGAALVAKPHGCVPLQADQELLPTGRFAEERTCFACREMFIARVAAQLYCDCNCFAAAHRRRIEL